MQVAWIVSWTRNKLAEKNIFYFVLPFFDEHGAVFKRMSLKNIPYVFKKLFWGKEGKNPNLITEKEDTNSTQRHINQYFVINIVVAVIAVVIWGHHPNILFQYSPMKFRGVIKEQLNSHQTDLERKISENM